MDTTTMKPVRWRIDDYAQLRVGVSDEIPDVDGYACRTVLRWQDEDSNYMLALSAGARHEIARQLSSRAHGRHGLTRRQWVRELAAIAWLDLKRMDFKAVWSAIPRAIWGDT